MNSRMHTWNRNGFSGLFEKEEPENQIEPKKSYSGDVGVKPPLAYINMVTPHTENTHLQKSTQLTRHTS